MAHGVQDYRIKAVGYGNKPLKIETTNVDKHFSTKQLFDTLTVGGVILFLMALGFVCMSADVPRH